MKLKFTYIQISQVYNSETEYAVNVAIFALL